MKNYEIIDLDDFKNDNMKKYLFSFNYDKKQKEPV